MFEQNTVIAVYRLHEDVEAAVKTLQQTGCDAEAISVAGRNFHTLEAPVGYHRIGDEVKPCGRLGSYWNELLAYSSEFVVLWVPDLGTLVVVGRFASSVIQASEDNTTFYGLTAFGIAFKYLGIPEDTILAYEDAIEHDRFLLIVQCDEKGAGRARSVLEMSEAEWLEIHHSSLETSV